MSECFDIAGCNKEQENKRKVEFHILVVVGIIIGVLTFVILLNSTTKPGNELCKTASECEGQPHPECEGSWACSGGQCSWSCAMEGAQPICSKVSDCIELPHADCTGEWACEYSKCVWACEVGQGGLKLDYSVGECNERRANASNVSIVATADGIRLSQVVDYVCCANITLDVERNGNIIKINERNVGKVCKCMCSYDVNAEIKVFPGVYKLEVWGVEYIDDNNNTFHKLEKLGERTVAVGSATEGILFIEQSAVTDGKLKAGTYPMRFLDAQGYTFDAEKRTLSGDVTYELADVKALYGSGVRLKGDAGSGSSAKLYGVKTIPEVIGLDKITKISAEGTVTLEHAGHTITLAPGESWSETTVEDDAGELLTGIIRLTNTDTVTNYGFLEVSDINLS